MTHKWAVDTQPEFMCLRESSDSANPFVSAKTVHITLKLYYMIKVIRSVVGGLLGSRVVSVLDSGAVGPGFKSQPRRCRVTVLGKLFTLIVPLFTKQQNW